MHKPAIATSQDPAEAELLAIDDNPKVQTSLVSLFPSITSPALYYFISQWKNEPLSVKSV